MQFIAILLIALGLILLWQSKRQRRSTGLPGGDIIYSDTKDWGKVDEPLFDRHLGLTGKPDYLIEQDNIIIPVEVKSTVITQYPYDSHIFQVAAYCYLVQRSYGVRPSHGILHYQNHTYKIPYTPELENALLDLIIEMRRNEQRGSLSRSHHSERRCLRCGYRTICDQKL
jgi:CRISPR-associated exonuclease Cas4